MSDPMVQLAIVILAFGVAAALVGFASAACTNAEARLQEARNSPNRPVVPEERSDGEG